LHCIHSRPKSRLVENTGTFVNPPRHLLVKNEMRITKAQYKGLDGYKYSGTDKSVVSRYILGPFWNWLVLLFPTNLAPNMVGLD
jgi:hypothetical protein